MARPVVVGVDGSPAATHALQWGADEAARRRLRLHLLHAFGWSWPEIPVSPEAYGLPAGHRGPADIRAAARRLVREAADAVRAGHPYLDVTVQVSSDLPAAALTAVSRNAAVVVLGSRGMGGFAGLLVGSVSIQVAAHAHCPTVVVRRPGRTGAGVLVGVDGSQPADAVIGYAFDEASSRRTGLMAVHAFRWPASTGSGDILPTVHDPALLRAEEERLLSETLAGWREKYPDVPVRTRLATGRPGPVLADASAAAELSVVGSRRHGPAAGLLLGSVSRYVLHHAASPVAVVPHR
jgi:nucleotide-binding universal stress UspA family protein